MIIQKFDFEPSAMSFMGSFCYEKITFYMYTWKKQKYIYKLMGVVKNYVLSKHFGRKGMERLVIGGQVLGGLDQFTWPKYLI